MKAIGLTEFGAPDVLRVVDLPTPEPGPGELRIRIHAAAVNPTDATFRAGGRAAQLADRTPPYIPGMDAAGVVDKVGPGTSERLKPGDRVIMLVVPMGRHGGAYAEQVVASEASVVRAPKNATDAEAATLLLNAVAAHLALDALALSAGQPIMSSPADRNTPTRSGPRSRAGFPASSTRPTWTPPRFRRSPTGEH
jgi:NADPH2:quinone reductase